MHHKRVACPTFFWTPRFQSSAPSNSRILGTHASKSPIRNGMGYVSSKHLDFLYSTHRIQRCWMDPRFRQKLRQLTWPSLSKDVLSTFPHFFFAKFLHFHIFKTYFHILEYEAFQIFFPLLNFGISQFYLLFLLVLFILEKKRGKFGNKVAR